MVACPCGTRFDWRHARPIARCNRVHLGEGFLFCHVCQGSSRSAHLKLALTRSLMVPPTAAAATVALGGISAVVGTSLVIAATPAAVFGPLAVLYQPFHLWRHRRRQRAQLAQPPQWMDGRRGRLGQRPALPPPRPENPLCAAARSGFKAVDVIAWVVYGACFNRGARVLMVDGSSKQACDVQVGDVLADGAGDPRGATVLAHVMQRAGAPKELVQLRPQLLVCKSHRVQLAESSRWVLPIESAGAIALVGDVELHNFVVEGRKPIVVEGTVLTSIGTHCPGTSDECAPAVHEVWSSATVVDLMRLHPHWPAVTLRSNSPLVNLLKCEAAAQRVLTGDTVAVRAALQMEVSDTDGY